MSVSALRLIIGLLLAYLAFGVLVAAIYRSALGGLGLVVAAIGMLGLALAVAWATSARRSRESQSPH